MSRPNMLFVLSDQHSPHVAGCYGDDVVRTPNLDELAARGVLFENAYCNYPLCAPSRMCLMSGRDPHEIGAFANQSVLASDTPTFGHALGQAGYDTVLCGRMHFNGPDQRHGFARRVFPEVGGPSAGELAGANRFDRVSIDKSGPGRNHYLLYDADCAAAARRFLEDRAFGGETDPFCLVVGFVGPHCPFVCPDALFDHYYEAVSLPSDDPSERRKRHPYSIRYAERAGIHDLTEEEIRRTRAAYYGMVEFDDRLVGEILETLSETGLADDTVVIYASDHGELAGEHGLWWKMSFYEGSVGVPLIVSWPRRSVAGKRVRTPVTLADLAPTLAEIGGAPPLPDVRRPGLGNLLTTDLEAPDRAVFSEMIGDAVAARLPRGPKGRPARMMRRGPWKCHYYHGERSELFNLADDPDERIDRARDPACAEVAAEMTAAILADWDPDVVETMAAAQRIRTDYLRGAPTDSGLMDGEKWRGPRDYGYVRATSDGR